MTNSMVDPKLGEFSLERMVRAVEMVRERLVRATALLERAGIPYAVIGDSAYMEWIARIDASAVRYTQDVSILIHHADRDRAARELERAGFIRAQPGSPATFLDGPGASKRDTVKVVLAVDTMPAHGDFAATDVDQATKCEQFRIVPFESLARVSLERFRINDKVNVRDAIDIGLIDETWLPRLPADLAARLKTLIDTPDG
jgi:hypothetical protein